MLEAVSLCNVLVQIASHCKFQPVKFRFKDEAMEITTFIPFDFLWHTLAEFLPQNLLAAALFHIWKSPVSK